MIAADSSSLIAHLSGEAGDDVAILDQALADRLLVLPPVVLTELLSDPELPQAVATFLQALPVLEIQDGYWQRAGRLRSRILAKGRKARLADTLIAQSCLDHGMPVIVRDRDFRNFAELAGLRLLPA